MTDNSKSDQRRIYINESIKAFNILLLGDDGEQLGTFPRKDALDKAYQQGLDLVQVGYNAQDRISICKIVDHGKYQYNLKKKEKEKKKSQKSKGVKEIKISYGIEENDLSMKVDKAQKLLSKGYNVKFSLKLKGRENVFRTQARDHMLIVVERLEKYGKSGGIKEENRGFSLILFAKLK